LVESSSHVCGTKVFQSSPFPRNNIGQLEAEAQKRQPASVQCIHNARIKGQTLSSNPVGAQEQQFADYFGELMITDSIGEYGSIFF